MTQADYDVVAGELLALAADIEAAKRPGYTIGTTDILSNFKRAGEQTGIGAGAAWAVHFLKHADAIISIMARPDLPVAEEAPGRFADAVNYLRLGFALWRERQAAGCSRTSPEG